MTFERTLLATIAGEKAYRTLKIHHVQALNEPERSRVLEAICSILSGYSQSYQSRCARAVSDLFAYMMSEYGGFSFQASAAAAQIRAYLNTAFRSARRRFLTEHDQWLALRKLLKRLISARVIPSLDLPPLSKHAPKLIRQTRSTKNVIEKIALPSSVHDRLRAPASSDMQFWRTLHRTSSDLFAAIVAAAQYEARKAVDDFHRGQQLIASTDHDALIQRIRSGRLLDTRLYAPNGQARSIFSVSHPQGFSNLLAVAHLTNTNLIYDRAFPGAHHVYDHPGGLAAAQCHLGLTIDTAIALFIVILTETGFNVDAIHAARTAPSDPKTPLTMPVDDAALTRLNVPKPRAKHYLHAISGDSPFNAARAIEALLEMTSVWRTAYSRDELWLYPGNRIDNAPRVMSATAFKGAWRRFLSRHVSIMSRLSEPISRRELRTLGGIVRWFDSSGNMTETARYLNNSATVALKNYIPPELQEAYYQFQIRRFQNLLITAAITDDKALLQRALRYASMDELNTALDQIVAAPALHRSALLRDLYPSESKSGQDNTRYTFLCSAENVAMLYCLTQALIAIKQEHPQIDLTQTYEDFQPIFWSSLWIAVADRLEHTADRNLKRTYTRGLELAGRPELFDFSCLNALF